MHGDTDLNSRCVDRLLADVVDTTVIEVGCGRGLLAGLLASSNDGVNATDIAVGPGMDVRHPRSLGMDHRARITRPDDWYIVEPVGLRRGD
jgi:hypothetical protein